MPGEYGKLVQKHDGNNIREKPPNHMNYYKKGAFHMCKTSESTLVICHAYSE